jgi:hypothetical protein
VSRGRKEGRKEALLGVLGKQKRACIFEALWGLCVDVDTLLVRFIIIENLWFGISCWVLRVTCGCVKTSFANCAYEGHV